LIFIVFNNISYDENSQLLNDIPVQDLNKINNRNIRFGDEELQKIYRRFKVDEVLVVQR